MIVSAGASLLLFALREGREVRADAGPQRSPFPGEPTPDGILAWCAGLRPGRPPEPEGASVEVRPSVKKTGRNRKPRPSALPGASEAQAVVLVSCYEFAGPGGWMSPQEETRFLDETRAGGRRAVRLGAVVEEPWKIA